MDIAITLPVNQSFANDSTSNQTLNDTVINHTLIKELIDTHMKLVTLNVDGFTIALVILYVPIFLMGVFGNGILFVIILTKHQLRSITNLFLCNLAVADLTVTIICIPIAVGEALYKIWLYGEFMCKVTGFLQGVTVAASVFTIALLSLDRFLAIRHPMIFRRLSNNKVAFQLIIVVWILSICLMSPLLIVKQVGVVDIIPTDPVYFCTEIWDYKKQRQHFDIALFVIVYVVPGVIICSSYGLIGSELWKEDVNLKRTESETSKGLGRQMMKGRKRVAKMLIALAVLFAVCWLPYHCVSLYLDFHDDEHLLVILPYTIFLGHSNSAFNPILYFYSSKNFRCVLKRMLRCKQKRFKPVRRENMVVRCTRNHATTTTALTRRPFIRIMSSSSLVSRSGSLRFSRSSNTSVRSTSGTARSSLGSHKSSTSNRAHTGHNDCMSLGINRSPRDKRQDKCFHGEKTCIKNDYCPVIAVIEPYCNDAAYANNDDDDLNDKLSHRKAFMEATISIPTTINEESSTRHNSLVPPVKMTPSPSIDAIREESEEKSSYSTCNSSSKDRNYDIPMKTFTVCSSTWTPTVQNSTE